MARNEIFDEIVLILKDIFDDEELEITEETTANDVEDWDSLEQINILVAVEQKFGVKFKLNDVSKLENVGAMVDLVEKML